MPTYSYECRKCGDVSDIRHGMSEAPRIKCVSCGGGTRKLIGTGAGIIFKGSGFYETDYKTKKGTPPAEAKSESGKPAADKAAAGAKSESKPAEGGAKTTPAKPAAAPSNN